MEMDGDISNPFLWPVERENNVHILETTTSDYKIDFVSKVPNSPPVRNSNALEKVSGRNVVRQVSKQTNEQVQQNSEQIFQSVSFYKLIIALWKPYFCIYNLCKDPYKQV